MQRFVLVILTLSTLLISACSEIENSAGKVLGNANSVLKSGRKAAWGEGDAAPTPVADDRRY